MSFTRLSLPNASPAAAFFHHFSNKSALIGAYLDRLKARIADELESAGDVSSTEKLKIINTEIASTAKDRSAFTTQIYAAITSGDRKLDLQHLDTGITGVLSQIIKEGQDKGEFSREWNPELVAVSLVSSWIVLPLAMTAPGFPSKPHARLLDLYLSGISTR